MKFEIDVPDKHILGTVYMLKEYFGVSVPPEYVKKLMLKNSYVFQEVKDGAYTDTAARDTIIDALANDLGVGHWPMNGDGEKYSKKFYKDFAEAAKKNGIGFEI